MAFTVTKKRESQSDRGKDKAESDVYIARADNDSETSFTARQASGIPQYGEVHPANAAVYVNSIVARQVAPRIFLVDVKYGPYVDQSNNTENPFLAGVKVTYDDIEISKPYNRALSVAWAYETESPGGTSKLTTTLNGSTLFVPPPTNSGLFKAPVVNSALEPFDPLPEREIIHQIITMTRNEQVLNLSSFAVWQNAVNTDPFFGADPGTLKLRIRPGDEQRYGSTKYRAVAYTFHHDPEGWDHFIQDRGFNELIESPAGSGDFSPRKIIDEFGNPPQREQLLNGAGRVLVPTSGVLTHATTRCVYAVYRPYDNRRAFAGLGLNP